MMVLPLADAVVEAEGIRRSRAGRRVVEDTPDRRVVRELDEPVCQAVEIRIVVGVVVDAGRAVQAKIAQPAPSTDLVCARCRRRIGGNAGYLPRSKEPVRL